MDVTALLAPISDDAPSGDNLEYDEGFTEMELAAQPGEERQVGDQFQAAEDPDYGEVVKLADGILGRSHDIRAAVFRAEAVLQAEGMEEFAQTVSYIRGCLADHWESCHPQLDEDDGDATMRINAVQGLADSSRTLRNLRRAALTDSRMFGRMSLRHVEVAEGIANPSADMESPPDAAALKAAFRDTDEAFVSGVADAVNTSLEEIAAIDAIFAEQTPGEGPQLDPLSDALKKIQNALAQHGGADLGVEIVDPTAAAAAPAPAGGAAPGPSGSGAINSPADVTDALDRIIDYYQRAEPSSPVPILLDRAKRLVNADFLAIIEDMAKDGLDEVKRIGGIKSDDGW